MRNMRGWSSVLVGAIMLLGAGRAEALPGQGVEEVAAWIQGNPTLRPASGEKLLVRKSDSAAQRFIFQASVLPPGKVAPARNAGVIRAESLSLFDMINGVTKERLEESLRAIYGLDVYQDYNRAQLVYAYPDPPDVAQARNRVEPLRVAIRGELRQGERFAYWLELAQVSTGYAYTGRITVFLKDDVEKLSQELRSR